MEVPCLVFPDRPALTDIFLEAAAARYKIHFAIHECVNFLWYLLIRISSNRRRLFRVSAHIFVWGWVFESYCTCRCGHFRILQFFSFSPSILKGRRCCMKVKNACVPHQNHRVDLGACCTTGKLKFGCQISSRRWLINFHSAGCLLFGFL